MSDLVGVVGLGNMGSGIAARLARSPRDGADEAATVLVSLPTPDLTLRWFAGEAESFVNKKPDAPATAEAVAAIAAFARTHCH